MSGLGPEARALVDAARDGDDPTPADRARVRRGVWAAAVGAGVAITATTATTATAGTTAGAGTAAGAGAGIAAGAAGGGVAAVGATSGGLLAVKVVATLAIVGGLGAAGVKGAHVYRAHYAQPVVAVPSTVATAPAGTASPATPKDEPKDGPKDGIDVVSSADSPAPKPPTVGVPPSIAAAAANTAPRPQALPSTLEEETALLRGAEVALRAGDAATALARLDEHAARFPNGVLSEERAAERVLALCNLGRVADARQDASQFLRDRPRSPLAARVRSSCGGQTP